MVATLRGEMYCLEFHRAQVRPPSFSSVCFTYIPRGYRRAWPGLHVILLLPVPAADAEVISIDAIAKEPNGVVIGVTLVKVQCIPISSNPNWSI